MRNDKMKNPECDALLLIAEKDKEIERLRAVLNKLEYYYDGTIRRYPDEYEVEVALRNPNV
jgi:hypothetical protein